MQARFAHMAGVLRERLNTSFLLVSLPRSIPVPPCDTDQGWAIHKKSISLLSCIQFALYDQLSQVRLAHTRWRRLSWRVPFRRQLWRSSHLGPLSWSRKCPGILCLLLRWNWQRFWTRSQAGQMSRHQRWAFHAGEPDRHAWIFGRFGLFHRAAFLL
jgi:hypothetical protein